MNATIFGRLLWKEYRFLRSFWIGMVVIAVLLELMGALVDDASSSQRCVVLFGLSTMFTALYALGCGATLFATEHEMGTFALLRSLPVSPMRLFWAKVTYAAISTPPLLAVLWLVAFVISLGQAPSATDTRDILGAIGVFTLELFVWGTLFSLLLKRPLLAAVLGVTTASTVVHVVSILVWRWEYPRVHQTRFEAGEAYYDAIVWRLLIVVIVGGVCCLLGKRWFRESRVVDDESDVVDGAGLEVASRRGARLVRRRQFRRLLWLQWRQSKSSMKAVVLMCVPGALVYGASIGGSLLTGHRNQVSGEYLAIFAILAICAVPVCGASVFMADQRKHRYRFLAEHGIRPGQVWWSRQVPFALLATLWCLVVVIGMSIVGGGDQRGASADDVTLAEVLFWTATGVMLAYSVGQFCSMLLPRPLIAGFSTLMLVLFAAMWAGWMTYLVVPWTWSVLPAVPLLLLASRLRTGDWMRQRNSLRAWLPIVALLVIPALATPVGVCIYRVTQIPVQDPDISVAKYVRPMLASERRAMAKYNEALLVFRSKKAAKEYTDPDGAPLPEPPEETQARESRWVEANSKAVALSMEASQEPVGSLRAMPWWERNRLSTYQIRDLDELLLADGRRLTTEGDLDAALDRYMAVLNIGLQLYHNDGSSTVLLTESVHEELRQWAGSPGQTSERVIACLDRLEEYWSRYPSEQEYVQRDYARLRFEIDTNGGGDPYLQRQVEKGSVGARLALAWQRMPWEQARSIRLLDYITSQRLITVGRIEARAERDLQINHDRSWYSHPASWYRLLQSTPTVVSGRFQSSSLRWDASRILDRVREYRLLQLQLGLVAWQWEHGELPDRLERLEGFCFDTLPNDPYSGQPYRYFPNGAPDAKPIPPTEEELFLHLSPNLIERLEMYRTTPFLWSRGWKPFRFWMLAHDNQRLIDLGLLWKGTPYPIIKPKSVDSGQ